MAKTIYDLEFDESLEIYMSGTSTEYTQILVRRVPGGWIYHSRSYKANSSGVAKSESQVFVPYNTEFLPNTGDNSQETESKI